MSRKKEVFLNGSPLTILTINRKEVKEMLVPCFECGEKISSEAKRCPKCGYRGYDGGYWWDAGTTAMKTQEYNSKEEAKKKLAEKYSELMAKVRSSYPGR